MLGLSILSLVVAGIAWVVFLATPQHGDYIYAYEPAAIRSLVIINTAQAQYRSMYGRYAANLAELGLPPNGGATSAAAADLITGDLALGVKSGYKFEMVGTAQGYSVYAEPQVFYTTGKRTFFTDQSTVIREHHGNERASVSDLEIK